MERRVRTSAALLPAAVVVLAVLCGYGVARLVLELGVSGTVGPDVMSDGGDLGGLVLIGLAAAAWLLVAVASGFVAAVVVLGVGPWWPVGSSCRAAGRCR